MSAGDDGRVHGKRVALETAKHQVQKRRHILGLDAAPFVGSVTRAVPERPNKAETMTPYGNQSVNWRSTAMTTTSAPTQCQVKKRWEHDTRTVGLEEMLEVAKSEETAAVAYSREASAECQQMAEKSKALALCSTEALKERLNEIRAVRRRMEEEMRGARSAIAGSAYELQRTQKWLHRARRRPKDEILTDEDMHVMAEHTEYLRSKLALRPDALEGVRSKVKAEAYTSAKGRQLSVLFSRFDKDDTGSLDEHEFRCALRRTLKIPQATISDEEVSLLFQSIDEDNSGTLEVKEIVAFLNSDCSVHELQERERMYTELISQLKEGFASLQADLRAKMSAYMIDDACAKLTPAKTTQRGGPSIVRKATDRGVAAHGNVLDDAVVERIRSRVKAASYKNLAGQNVASLYHKIDRDGNGVLSVDEVRDAMRRLLKIPPSVVSDGEIATLVGMMGPDESRGTATVTLSAFLSFIGAEKVRAKTPVPARKEGAPQQDADSDDSQSRTESRLSSKT